ncbi:hypothetical protein E6C27_scaffold207G001040 [Cucumis melo var. makuwa]|uniref:Uncharacterized protein n=1 Tax=Cucumis melo var. makuwa TaxID=1194695 RepID=A0A5A7UDK1_CUCMM|nr:hypothetical protein E6C27_scaffold207G001040 [Cucumis melo var. makuwa]
MSLSTQLLGLGRLEKKGRKKIKRESSKRERNGYYSYKEVSDNAEHGDSKGRRRRRRRKKGQFGTTRDVLHMNFWYFTSTISHILRKAKAFYNECCCDAYEDERMFQSIDPYFSMPVLPYTTMANCLEEYLESILELF